MPKMQLPLPSRPAAPADVDPSPSRRIRELDGWRGVSILLVVIGHLIGFRFCDTFGTNLPLIYLADRCSHVGVSIFFGISGFVITRLLLSEERIDGGISARAFYVRRAMKILPPLAIYLLVAGALSLGSIIDTGWRSFVQAALMLSNYEPLGRSDWLLAHTWSLSVEEQYYLVFPALMMVVQQRLRAAWLWPLAVATTLLGVTHTAASSAGWIDTYGGYACIAAGALVAWSGEALIRRAASVPVPDLIILACLVYLLISPSNIGGRMLYQLLAPVLIAIMLLLSLGEARAIASLMNSRPLQFLGAISYSLYLWQQLFLTNPLLYSRPMPLLELPLMMLPVAWLSHHRIERPLTRLGSRWSARLRAATRRTPPDEQRISLGESD